MEQGKQPIRMITGQDSPDSSSINIGETVKLGYVDQSRDDLNPNSTVWEEISDGLDEIELGKRKMQGGHTAECSILEADQQKKLDNCLW